MITVQYQLMFFAFYVMFERFQVARSSYVVMIEGNIGSGPTWGSVTNLWSATAM